MTEAEAKTKLCPQLSRGISVTPPTGATVSLIKCFGSDCMWWRGTDGHPFAVDAEGRTTPLPQDGFCGIAGRP